MITVDPPGHIRTNKPCMSTAIMTLLWSLESRGAGTTGDFFIPLLGGLLVVEDSGGNGHLILTRFVGV